MVRSKLVMVCGKHCKNYYCIKLTPRYGEWTFITHHVAFKHLFMVSSYHGCQLWLDNKHCLQNHLNLKSVSSIIQCHHWHGFHLICSSGWSRTSITVSSVPKKSNGIDMVPAVIVYALERRYLQRHIMAYALCLPPTLMGDQALYYTFWHW
jgi:hypothetical protein